MTDVDKTFKQCWQLYTETNYNLAYKIDCLVYKFIDVLIIIMCNERCFYITYKTIECQ